MHHHLEPFCKVKILAKLKKSLYTAHPIPTPVGTQAAQKGVEQVLKQTVSSSEVRQWQEGFQLL